MGNKSLKLQLSRFPMQRANSRCDARVQRWVEKNMVQVLATWWAAKTLGIPGQFLVHFWLPKTNSKIAVEKWMVGSDHPFPYHPCCIFTDMNGVFLMVNVSKYTDHWWLSVKGDLLYGFYPGKSPFFTTILGRMCFWVTFSRGIFRTQLQGLQSKKLSRRYPPENLHN